MADVFFGVDNTFLSRAIKEDVFEPYESPLLSKISENVRLDPGHRLLPVDFGDVCLNYDKKWFQDHQIPPPRSLLDITKPEYKGLTVLQNPATSSPGLAFLLTTIGVFGEEGYIRFWKKLKENDVLVTDGWKTAYWGHFTAASKGKYPIVVSYASSPPAEVHFSKKKMTEAPTAAVLGKQTTYRQIEFVGILKGTQNRRLAEKWIDFMLGKVFQEDIPLQMFVYPVNVDANLPDVFVKHSKIATDPVSISPDAIELNREKWIETWATAVIR
jgi:thiamine transport system substrate-binding protein